MGLEKIQTLKSGKRLYCFSEFSFNKIKEGLPTWNSKHEHCYDKTRVLHFSLLRVPRLAFAVFVKQGR